MSSSTIGVIGAGTMGSGIAQVAAMAGHEVRIYDSNAEAIMNARNRLLGILNRLAEKQKISDQEAKAIFGRIYFLDSLSGMRDTTLVIEAVVEDLQVKRRIFEELEQICPPDTVLASNTSSLSVTAIAGGCERPERVLGIHFFNPAPLMRLVEIIPAVQTAAVILSTTRTLVESWGKTVAIASDTPGFIVNRVARPYYSEAIRLYEERLLNGIPDGEEGYRCIDEAMTDAGFRMGPFTLMDFIGNDVNYAVTRSVWEACNYEPRYAPGFLQKQHVDAGWLGKKSNRGYYDYNNKSSGSDKTFATELKQLISGRIITMLIHEAADAVLKGVATPSDIDLAMTSGVNYPIELLKEADRLGASAIVEEMDQLFGEYHDPRYRCSPILRKYAREGGRFYD